MSHIFDALQTSEAARTGGTQPGPISVTELLERTELQEVARHLGKSAGEQWSQLLSPDEPASGEEISNFSFANLGAFVPPLESHVRADFFERLGVIEIASSSNSHLAAINDKHSPAAEAFRLLGVRLNKLRKERTLRKLLITSTIPQEGKTFTAANLACAFPARTQEKVLLIDGDLRRAQLSETFGLSSSSGLCEYLREERELTSSIFRLKGHNVWILPAGKTPANPLELIQSSKLPTLVDELTTQFDWIIVDSPPVLPLADTSAWARMMDGVLLVTRPGITEKRNLLAGVEALEPKKLIGAVLNSSRSPAASDYGYYGAPAGKQNSEAQRNHFLPLDQNSTQ